MRSFFSSPNISAILCSLIRNKYFKKTKKKKEQKNILSHDIIKKEKRKKGESI